MKRTNKGLSTKHVIGTAWHDDHQWTVAFGRLRPGRGRPRKVTPLIRLVAEKIPFEALDRVCSTMKANGLPLKGIYIAHDSMGVPRYIGRGAVRYRLKARRKAQVLELKYFSIYVGMNETHERELETVLIRAAGPQLFFNTRKKREDIEAGSVRDYEPGTWFFERQYRRGRRAKRSTRMPSN